MQRNPWRLVLLGAPGVGKGTQAGLLSARLGACHLSTGDLFRAAEALPGGPRSAVMSQALDYMRQGALVPDPIVLALIQERIHCLCCGAGCLLDGFPRTVAQAEALQALLAGQHVRLDAALSYELPVEKLIARLGGRRFCPHCQAVFHLQNRPPRQNGVCDHCGARLLQRQDDRPEAIQVRLESYERNTAPLADYYRKKGLLVSISAGDTPEETFARTMTALEQRNRTRAAPREPSALNDN